MRRCRAPTAGTGAGRYNSGAVPAGIIVRSRRRRSGLTHHQPARALDACLWFLLPAVLLWVVPIGFVSNDGLGHSSTFAAGTWRLNPNHLLFEPLGAWWQNLWSGSALPDGRLPRLARLPRLPVDALKLLSALAGALAAGLFRYGVAPRVAESRSAANWATAWLACSSAFLRLWVSDEFHMIQMPFVVAMAWTALRAVEKPSFARALALGAATGLAALAFISNLVLGAALAAVLAIWSWSRRDVHVVQTRAGGTAIKGALGTAVGTVLVAGPSLVAAWAASPGAPDLVTWLLHYGGGQSPPRAELAYGVAASWDGLAGSIARAFYGSASALVDLTPAVAALRDRELPTAGTVLGVLAFLAASASMLYGGRVMSGDRAKPENRNASILVVAWTATILGFGIFWNNSDDQFYFQLAPAFGVLGARACAIPGRRHRSTVAIAALGLLGLLWNVFDVTSRRVLYPRHERIALIEAEVRGACLAIVPGFDEPELLLALLLLEEEAPSGRRARRDGRPPGPATSGRLAREEGTRPTVPASPAPGGRRFFRSRPTLALTDLAVRETADTGIPRLLDRIEKCRAGGGRVVLIDVFDTPRQRNPWKFLRLLGYDREVIEHTLAGLTAESASRSVGPFKVRTIQPG